LVLQDIGFTVKERKRLFGSFLIMKKLKIALLSSGALRHIKSYIDFLQSKGHQVFWFAFQGPIQNINVETFDISRGVQVKNKLSKWKYFLASSKLKKLLHQIKPDILHGHYVTSSGVISLLSGFKPVVLTVHGSDLILSEKSLLWRKILKTAFNRAALINVVSDQLEALTRKLGVPDSKIFKSTFGVDIESFNFKPFSQLSSPPKLICTRGLGKVYDPLSIVNACKILKQKKVDFALSFAASGPMEPQVRDAVEKENLQDQIRFLGGYENSELPQLLHSHDIYISATHWDGTSISLLEAMASGIFPIVSRVPGNLAWLKDDKTSLMFTCGKGEELARKIQFVLSNPELIRSATELNRKLVEKDANREINLLKLEQKYYEVIN
jgi:glycosyltransferase involved in cell wall biosynthesis